jgi:putative ABC transport system permease protein
MQQLTGVKFAALASNLPASGAESVSIHIQGQQESRLNQQHTAADVVVTPDYFRVIGVSLVSGRAFSDHDDATAPRVVIVNQEFVHKYFQDHDPVGKQIQLDISGAPPVWSEIVGVVANVKSDPIEPGTKPQIYESYVQRPVASFSLMLRSAMDPASLTPALRHVVAQLDPELPVLRVLTMDGVIEASRNGNPFFTRILATFAILALALSALGIYGLIAYSVGQRTHEIGIRLALGAKPSDISRMIMRQGFQVAAIGSAIGFALALPLPKVFDAIFGLIHFAAPVVYPIVLAVMLMVVFCSTLGPARRATRVDATQALRNE